MVGRRVVPTNRPAPVIYLMSHYPAVSHVFIQREIRALRAAGLEVETYSLFRTPESELLTPVDREEASSTTSLRPVEALALTFAHAGTLIRHPGAYVTTLWLALKNGPPGLGGRVRQVMYFGQAVLFARHVRRSRATHIHAHLANVATDVAWLATELLRREGRSSRTWSFTLHGSTEFGNVAWFNLAAKAVNADLVVCISDYTRAQLMGLTPPEAWPKFAVVHCGVSIDQYTPIERAHDRRLRLITVGRLSPEKGQTLLLDAIKALRDRGIDVSAVLVGDGPERDRLTALREDLGLTADVSIPGATGQDALPRLLSEANVFCLTSFTEGLPVVLMEAMATGLAVLATAIAGIPELIDDGRSGVLIPAGRLDRLIEALAHLAEDPDYRARLGLEARRRVVDEFDVDREAKTLAALFDRMSPSSAVLPSGDSP